MEIFPCYSSACLQSYKVSDTDLNLYPWVVPLELAMTRQAQGINRPIHFKNLKLVNLGQGGRLFLFLI